jgi:hypothetical protein
MKKRTKIILIVSISLILLITAVWFFFFRPPKQGANDNDNVNKGGESSSGSQTPPVPAAPAGNDEFPLQKGSSGERVKYVQMAVNKINPLAGLKEDGIFGKSTYEGLITFVETRFYPVTVKNYVDLLNLAYPKQ